MERFPRRDFDFSRWGFNNRSDKTTEKKTDLEAYLADVLKPYLKPIDVKRIARVQYDTVIDWIEKGHPRAGKLPALDFSERGKRRSYRIRPEDWEEFQHRLEVPAHTRAGQEPISAPAPRPPRNSKGHFDY